MNNIITLPKLTDLLSKNSSIAKPTIQNFLLDFTTLIGEAIASDGFVKIKGIGTFRRILVNGKVKIDYTPEREISEYINSPFGYFEPVELADNVTPDMLEASAGDGTKRNSAPEERSQRTRTAPVAPAQERPSEDRYTQPDYPSTGRHDQEPRYPESRYDQEPRYPESRYDQEPRYPESRYDQEPRYPESRYSQESHYPEERYEQEQRYQEEQYSQEQRYQEEQYSQEQRYSHGQHSEERYTEERYSQQSYTQQSRQPAHDESTDLPFASDDPYSADQPFNVADDTNADSNARPPYGHERYMPQPQAPDPVPEGDVNDDRTFGSQSNDVPEYRRPEYYRPEYANTESAETPGGSEQNGIGYSEPEQGWTGTPAYGNVPPIPGTDTNQPNAGTSNDTEPTRVPVPTHHDDEDTENDEIYFQPIKSDKRTHGGAHVSYSTEESHDFPWFWAAMFFVLGLVIGFAVGYFCHDQIASRIHSNDERIIDLTDSDYDPVIVVNNPNSELLTLDLESSEEGFVNDEETEDATEAVEDKAKDDTEAAAKPKAEEKKEAENKEPEKKKDSDKKKDPAQQPIYDTVTAKRLLPTMAREYYGDIIYWVYIYKENQDKIKNPHNIQAGTRVRIPPREKYDVSDNESVNREHAKKIQSEIYTKYGVK